MTLGAMSIEHWLIVIGIAVCLFGSGRIKALLADLGGGIREGRKALREAANIEKEPKP